MGLFTSICHNGDEIQIKTGLDMCNWYDVGDTVGDYIEDGVYKGIRTQAHSEKHHWWWVVIDERVVQTPFQKKEGESQLHAMKRYLKKLK